MRHAVAIPAILDPIAVLLRGTPDQVAREAERIVRIGYSQGGYLFCTGEMNPRDTPVENVKAMIAAVREARGGGRWHMGITCAGVMPTLVVGMCQFSFAFHIPTGLYGALATRKPTVRSRLSGTLVARMAERTRPAPEPQSPPRSTREVPEEGPFGSSGGDET